MTLLTVVGITKRIIDIDNCRHLRNNMLWSYPIIIDTKKKRSCNFMLCISDS